MFVQFTLDSEAMQEAVSHASDVRVSIKHLDRTDDGAIRTVFWAIGSDLQGLERGLQRDDTVTDFRSIATNGNEHLYRALHPPDLKDVTVPEAAIRADGVLLDATTEAAGWEMKMLFPDRESFTEFRSACGDVGLAVDVDSIYSKPFAAAEDDLALTDPQRDLLRRAVEVGYFDIPRQTTLQELGQQMDISGQAASERLRRGMETLVRETVTDEGVDAVSSESDR
jgi:predicted DNA binding protein